MRALKLHRTSVLFAVVVLICAAFGIAALVPSAAKAGRNVVVEVQFDRQTGQISYSQGGDVTMRRPGTIGFRLTTVGPGTSDAILTGIIFVGRAAETEQQLAPRDAERLGVRAARGS